ncbi:glutamyl-tRNA synthetase [Massariosphaeria phaeospora]|uniref:Glutamyl-tRNA synthetase n=1 Tax=Massariosphaeria phaeospora TaxID=100035 RepID=A0A7C8MGC7_9PLEO|nr:glutamyl-tRNA synthetase [Massariosphaeria phaeospora]
MAQPAGPYEAALAAIDAEHAKDPKKITVDGADVPYELHYAQKCTSYLSKHTPDASEALRLAVRAQHFRRWEVPRDSYPMTRVGYLTWRTHLKKRQADYVARICDEVGYKLDVTNRVSGLIRKEGLKDNEETQVLEDVACLVFLDDQFEQFEKEHNEEKILNILRKTWGKMTEKGHELALQIPMSGRPQELVQKALAG